MPTFLWCSDMKVEVRIESEPTTDTYARAHGKSVDEPLMPYEPRFGDHGIGVTGAAPFTHTEEVDLLWGRHYVEYAASGYVPPPHDYAWHAKIFVDGVLKAEGDVGRNTPLRASFRIRWYLGALIDRILRR